MNPAKTLVDKLTAENLWQESVELKRNEYLKVSGSIDTNVYLMLEGSIRIYVIDEFEEHTIRFAYGNDLFGALDSFITEQPSELYIQALKKTNLKKISKDIFMEFIKENSENLSLWQELLTILIHQQMERERDILTSSPKERYNRVLKRSPELFQQIPHKYIASYLRMTPETLSRLKKS